MERILRTQPVPSIPSPVFYRQLCSNLDSMGWEHLAWLSPELTTVHLRLFDVAGREHIVQVDVPPEFPEVQPTASADLPISVDLGHLQGPTLKDICSQYQSALEKFQDFWNVMEEVDRKLWILEPDHPSRANKFRRIALGGHCSLSIVVDPLSPRSLPECQFFGSDAVIAPLGKKLNTGFKQWDESQLLVENLEKVLEMTFPSFQDDVTEDMSADCGICYAYRASDGLDEGERPGKIPDRVCNNVNCARPFHSTCLTEWLQSITTTRKSFNVFFGHCPYCSHPIAVKSASG